MVTKSMRLPPDQFFHARPAAVIASVAKKYQSVVMIALGMELADAKNPFALMRLSHPKGEAFDILADGQDENEAAEAVAAAIEKIFSGTPQP